MIEVNLVVAALTCALCVLVGFTLGLSRDKNPTDGESVGRGVER